MEFEATRTPGRCLFDVVLEASLGLGCGDLNEVLALFLETNADAREWCRRYSPFKKFPGGRGSCDIAVTPDLGRAAPTSA